MRRRVLRESLDEVSGLTNTFHPQDSKMWLSNLPIKIVARRKRVIWVSSSTIMSKTVQCRLLPRETSSTWTLMRCDFAPWSHLHRTLSRSAAFAQLSEIKPWVNLTNMTLIFNPPAIFNPPPIIFRGRFLETEKYFFEKIEDKKFTLAEKLKSAIFLNFIE